MPLIDLGTTDVELIPLQHRVGFTITHPKDGMYYLPDSQVLKWNDTVCFGRTYRILLNTKEWVMISPVSETEDYMLFAHQSGVCLRVDCGGSSSPTFINIIQ